MPVGFFGYLFFSSHIDIYDYGILVIVLAFKWLFYTLFGYIFLDNLVTAMDYGCYTYGASFTSWLSYIFLFAKPVDLLA